MASRKAPDREFVEAGLSLLRKERVFIKNRFRNLSPQAKQAPEPVLASNLNRRDSRRSVTLGQDSCPQLGAALAYYDVLSLAPPLVVILLGVFGLVYGGKERSTDVSSSTIEDLSF
jgi:hypothetical protein